MVIGIIAAVWHSLGYGLFIIAFGYLIVILEVIEKESD